VHLRSDFGSQPKAFLIIGLLHNEPRLYHVVECANFAVLGFH
jgi:hypothetical protein